MDKGLFAKHFRNIIERNSSKQKLIAEIFKRTGVDLEDDEISLSRKSVTFTVSSVKKTVLIQKGVKDVLSDLGYMLSL